jgi:plasmid replication initiation protein
VLDHHSLKPGERATLDPFAALAGDIPPRDQRDLTGRPFFYLVKTKRVRPILYKSGTAEAQVHALPEHGMAPIWDADVLIWAASQTLAAMDRALPASRFFRPTPYRLLTSIGRATGSRKYLLLKGALSRLQSTVIRTTTPYGEHWHRQQFSWIDESEELVAYSGRCEGIEFVLPDCFYRGVIDHRLVLAIDPAYFVLTGGIERWLYRVARKHAGRQPQGWCFELRHLYTKSASLARYSDFAFDICRVVRLQPLLDYAGANERAKGTQAVIVMRATVCTAAMDNLWEIDADIAISGADHIEISGTPVSGLQAHKSRRCDWNLAQTQHRKDSKSESKSFVVDGAQACPNAPMRRGRRRRRLMIVALLNRQRSGDETTATHRPMGASSVSGRVIILAWRQLLASDRGASLACPVRQPAAKQFASVQPSSFNSPGLGKSFRLLNGARASSNRLGIRVSSKPTADFPSLTDSLLFPRRGKVLRAFNTPVSELPSDCCWSAA